MVLHAGWDDIARSFREFYSNASNRVDIRGLKHFDRYDEIPDYKWISLAKENPIHFLVNGSSGFFSEDDDGFHLSEDLASYVDLGFFIDQVRDAMEYRVTDFRRTRYMERDNRVSDNPHRYEIPRCRSSEYVSGTDCRKGAH